MKKKLFTLMMLLVCIGGGKIWGADIVASYTFDGSATSGTNVAGTNCTVSYYKIGNSGSNIVTVSDETF